MRYLMIIAAVLYAAGTPVYAQQLTARDVLAIKERTASGGFSARSEWTALGYYLQGVIEGAAGYQQALTAAGKPALFCPPKGKNYSVDEIFRFLDRASDEDKSRPASAVIIEAYAGAFPCRE
ncbi:MAG: Rap1a/Tai family immunity protein [Pseudomonadota bacterium]